MIYIISNHEALKVGDVVGGGIATYQGARVGSGWEVCGRIPAGGRVVLSKILPKMAGISCRMRAVVVTENTGTLVYFSTKVVSPNGELLGLFKSPGDAAAWRRSPDEGEILPFGDIVEVPPGKFHGFRTDLATGAFSLNAPVVAWW